MKKTSKLFNLAVALAAGCLAVAALEVFDLHPQLNVGTYHAYWVGVRKMNLNYSGPAVIPLTTGKTQIYKEYTFGLFLVVRAEGV